jgi:hypothetical protein
MPQHSPLILELAKRGAERVAAARKDVSLRMKKYWAAKKKPAGKVEMRPGAQPD